MAGDKDHWWPCKLKYLEANYERCKLKVRQDSLYCKLFILEYQNRLEEERRITLKYEKNAVEETGQKHIELANNQEVLARNAVENLANVENEWKTKTDNLTKQIECLKEKQKIEIKSKDDTILHLTKEVQVLRNLSSLKGALPKNAQEEFDKILKTQQEKPQISCKMDRQVRTTSKIDDEDTGHGVEESCGVSGKGQSCEDVTNLLLDNSENLESISGEKFGESQLGSVLEVTEEMLKNCRRRSVLKRSRKSQVPDVIENVSEDLGGSEKQVKTRRERRVTFNGELEFKLPDGSKELAELVIDDSNGEIETHVDQNEEVCDDILSYETHEQSGVDVLASNDEKEVISVDTKTLEESREPEGSFEQAEKLKSREDEDCASNVHSQTHATDGLGGSPMEDRQIKKGKRKKSKQKTDENSNVIQECGNVNKTANAKNKVDIDESGSKDVKDETGKKNRRFSVEADILLSVDRQAQEEKLSSGIENTCKKKTHSKQTDSEEAKVVTVQLQDTVERRTRNGPKRGLRRENCNKVNTTKRLVDAFGEERELNELQSRGEDRKTQKGKKGKGSKVAKTNMVDAPRQASPADPDTQEDLENGEDKNIWENIALEKQSCGVRKGKSKRTVGRKSAQAKKTTSRKEYRIQTRNSKARLAKADDNIGDEVMKDISGGDDMAQDSPFKEFSQLGSEVEEEKGKETPGKSDKLHRKKCISEAEVDVGQMISNGSGNDVEPSSREDKIDSQEDDAVCEKIQDECNNKNEGEKGAKTNKRRSVFELHDDEAEDLKGSKEGMKDEVEAKSKENQPGNIEREEKPTGNIEEINEKEEKYEKKEILYRFSGYTTKESEIQERNKRRSGRW
ncbi:DNA ligase 1-like [Dendronephthya gigantea]|uniref:DNA ligase 1-like n=1 Tax=Dendronephthya gigantea TaxID=151771 RepID=UPI001069F8F6|nr:DNA ligase 1-like [Dendronephthya gigantea]